MCIHDPIKVVNTFKAAAAVCHLAVLILISTILIMSIISPACSHDLNTSKCEMAIIKVEIRDVKCCLAYWYLSE